MESCFPRVVGKMMKRRKIVLLAYEIAIGVMLIIALYYTKISYELGAKDCIEWRNWMAENYWRINISNQTELPILYQNLTLLPTPLD